jgi:2-oxoglutarate ferredoxin oxidoreductase subunit beta
MTPREEITVDYSPGTVETVRQHDGSILNLRKLEDDYDPTDRLAAMAFLQERQAEGEVVTGLLYVDPDATDLSERINTVDAPLNTLGAAELCPGSKTIEAINASLR